MLATIRIWTLACMGLVGLTLPAGAASFDCAKASRADEVAICASPVISALDSEMGGLWYGYSSLPFLMGMKGVRQDEAQQFVKDRGACAADAGCLQKVYQARIDKLRIDLKSGIAQIATEPQAGFPPPIEAQIASYAEQCRQLGGSLTQEGSLPHVLTADFDGDGTPDYMLDTQGLACSGSASAFCGNGGCQVDIAVSGSGFKSVSTLGGEPTITQGQDVAGPSLWVSGANCEGLKTDQACWLSYSWKDGQAVERYEARPRID